jgi:hypothetical protein
VEGSEASVIVETMTGGNWNPNDENLRCALLIVGDTVARVVIWQYTHSSTMGVPRGNLAWYHANGPWGGAYSNSSGGTFPSVPTDIQEKYPNAVAKEINCSDLPGPPPLALQ